MDDRTTAELLNLKKLHDAGVLDEEEYSHRRNVILDRVPKGGTSKPREQSLPSAALTAPAEHSNDDDFLLPEPETGQASGGFRGVQSGKTFDKRPPPNATDTDSPDKKTPTSGCSFPGCLLVVLLFGWIGYLTGFDVSDLAGNSTAPSVQQKVSSSTGSFNAEARKAKACCDDCGGSFSVVNGCSPNSMCYGSCLMGGDPFPGLNKKAVQRSARVLTPSQAALLSMGCCSENGGNWQGDDCYGYSYETKQGFISCHGGAVVRFPSGKEYPMRDHARKFFHCLSRSGC